MARCTEVLKDFLGTNADEAIKAIEKTFQDHFGGDVTVVELDIEYDWEGDALLMVRFSFKKDIETVKGNFYGLPMRLRQAVKKSGSDLRNLIFIPQEVALNEAALCA